jgi:hypothetical protein
VCNNWISARYEVDYDLLEDVRKPVNMGEYEVNIVKSALVGSEHLAIKG